MLITPLKKITILLADDQPMARATDHVFLYRNQPVCKDLIRGRIKAAGERVGVKVYPHHLRHTAATQLLNAGCRVTSIQKFLGHKKLNTTMIYARVHDQTVAEDYYAAMSQVEKRLELSKDPPVVLKNPVQIERDQLIQFVDLLARPKLNHSTRLEIVAKMRQILVCPKSDQGAFSPPISTVVEAGFP